MKRKLSFLVSALIIGIVAFATGSLGSLGDANEIVYDFSSFNAETDQPTSDKWSYAAGEWGSVRNAEALETASAINERLANVLFTCSGSGNIVWQLYAANEGYGNQIVMNNSGVSINLPEAKAGNQIVFHATANREAEFAGATIAKNAEYADYTIVAEEDAPTIALPRGLTIRTITIKKSAAPVDKTWDFTKIAANDTIGFVDNGGNMTGKYSDDPNAWAAFYNNAAFEGELMMNATEAFGPTKGLSFKADGSKWLYIRFYPEEYGGWQLYSNNKDLQITIPAAEGKVVVLTAYNDSESAITVVSGAKEESVALGKAYDEVMLNATADKVVLQLPKKTYINKIEVKEPLDVTVWDFTTITANDSIGFVDNGGNMTGKYSDDPNAWAAFYNNGAFEGELMMNATEAFGPTKGLSFKADGSKWLLVRFYPEEYGGLHFCSNNKDLQLSIPAGAGKAVIMKIGGNGGTISVLSGAAEESITSTKAYEFYMLNATADTVALKLFKNCYIQKIFVGDAPSQSSPALKVAQAELEVNAGETAAIEYTTKNEIAPTFASSDETIAKVDATGKITAVAAGTATITLTSAANPFFQAATAEVTVKVKTAGVTAIDQLVADAVKAAEEGAATLELAEGGEYQLDTLANAGMCDLTIEGNGAKIVVGEGGAFSIKQGLTLKNVKIDAANGTLGLIQLAAMTEAADSALWNLHGENGKNSFFNEKAITLEKVSVSGLTTALIQNADRWCVKNLTIKNSIFQLNAASGKFIDFQKGGGDGMIKTINIEGSTFYNIQVGDGMFFLAYNTSKPMPDKFYGTDDPNCSWTMTNNTFVQCFKQMSDRYTENKVATVKWTKNVWYSHTNLTKTRNCTFEMTETDNSGFGGSLGSFGTTEDTKIVAPAEAFDFNEDALVENFSLFKRTLAYESRMGDTRWLTTGKTAAERAWDFSANATNYADDWAAIKADAENWGQVKAGQEVRYQYIKTSIDTVEVNAGENKVGFLQGIYWAATAANKLIVGDGSNATYACLQLQKGIRFFLKDVYAGDTIVITACNTGKSDTEDCVKFYNGYPAVIGLTKAGNYTAQNIIAVTSGDFEVEAAADTRLQKIEIRPSTSDYAQPTLSIRLKNDMAKDETTVAEDGTVTVKEFNTKGVRMKVGGTDSIAATTKNAMVPVTFTSSNEEVVKVDENGCIEAVAPGVATITIEQAKGAGFNGAKLERFIVVNPELTFHAIQINDESENCELVYTPDAIGYVPGANNNGINDYHVLPAYASWMFYNNGNDGDGYVQAKTGNNSWMKIDYREGANDSVCHMACPNSEITGTNACYRPTTSGDYTLTMDYYVTGVEAVKFYYCTSASTVGGLRLVIFENTVDSEPVDSVIGVSDQKGKAQNGFSFTVEKTGLDASKNYIIRAQREGAGDPLVYAAKFYGEKVAPRILFPEGKYYIKNEATGMFWGAGNNWGTQASLVKHAEFVTLHPQDDGTYQMETQVSNGGTAYFFNGSYMDNGSPVSLTITETADGNYTIANGSVYYGYNGTNTIIDEAGVAADSENAHWMIYSEEDMQAQLEAATEQAPVDATYLILDPNFGRNNRNVEAWTMEASNKNMSGGNNLNNCAESWQAAFTMSQTINVPNGKYVLNAQAALTDYTGAYDGADYPVVYANENTSVFINMEEEDRATSMSKLSESFTAGKYAVEPIIVFVTDGKLTVGVKGTRTNTWCIWDNFELTYYGEAVPEDPELKAPEGWTSVIVNGNLASDNTVNFFSKEAPATNPTNSVVVAGAGKNGSRGIVLKSSDNPSKAWDTQFFIQLSEKLADGTKLHVEFDYKADKAAHTTTQAHSTPGNYMHNECIGNPDFTDEWQHYSYDVEVTGAMADMQTIAFNLSEETTATEYHFDNFGIWIQKPKPVDNWVDIMKNGDMEGTTVENFFSKEAPSTQVVPATIYDGVGVDGSRGFMVKSVAGAANDWDTQFWIYLPFTLPEGTKYKVEFDYKADRSASADTQAHGEPGNYIHYVMVGSPDFTTEWQHYEKTGTISGDQAEAKTDGVPNGNKFRSIAFNLSKDKANDVTFYFDNIKVYVENDFYQTGIGVFKAEQTIDDESVYTLGGHKVTVLKKGQVYLKKGVKFVAQ